MYYVHLFKAFNAWIFIALLSGCVGTSPTPADGPYPETYQSRIQTHPATAAVAPAPTQAELRKRFNDFIDFFSELREADIERRTQQVYADDLYFNDTLKTFSSRQKLASYLGETARRVEFNRVEIYRIVPFGDDYFMQWTMRTGFKMFGKLIETESIGITHVRLDGEGKVNFHQDFWDNTEGLFSHLPVVGYVVRRTRDSL